MPNSSSAPSGPSKVARSAHDSPAANLSTIHCRDASSSATSAPRWAMSLASPGWGNIAMFGGVPEVAAITMSVSKLSEPV